MMKYIPLSYFFIAVIILLTEHVKGQEVNAEIPVRNRILLNDVKKNERISLKEVALNISVKSRRKEELHCRILKGNQVIKETSIQLNYGINESEIPIRELTQDLHKGDVFHFHFEGRYFGKGGFDFFLETPPIMIDPAANIQVIPSDVNCEVGLISSVEFLGGVQGGTAPYELTWLVSKGPYIKDMINQPLKFELNNDQEVSKIVVAESLDYYVTLLVKDACGNHDKKVMHLKCRKDENEGVLYFQPIELHDKTSEL